MKIPDSWTRFETVILGLEKLGGLYLAPFSFLTLVSYIQGYTSAVVDFKQGDPMTGFREWLCMKLKNSSSLHWSGIVLSIAAEDSQKALGTFFELFKEFLEWRRKHGVDFILNEGK